MKNSNIQDYRFAAWGKIVLLSSSFFILWSVLALISSIYQPFSISGASSQSNGGATSLADSLFLEIVQSYFSIFSISFLAILVLAVTLGFLWSWQISNEFFPFHENQKPLSVLIKRFFLAKSSKIIDLNNFDAFRIFNDLGRKIYGPAKIQTADNAVIHISKGLADFRVVTANGNSPVEIASDERLEKVVPINQNEFIINLFAPDSFDLFKSLQLRYTLQLIDLHEKVYRSGLGYLVDFGDGEWREILESMIRLEFDRLITMEKKLDLEMASLEQPSLTKETENVKLESQTHSLYGSAKPLFRSKIARNRKRGQYHLFVSDHEFMSESESRQWALEELQPFMGRFMDNLRRTTIHLFGHMPIKIIDYEIGK